MGRCACACVGATILMLGFVVGRTQAQQTATSATPTLWENTPGDIITLVNTSALFNWTHTIPGSVDISWLLLSSGKRIMSLSQHKELTKSSEFRDRLDYVEFRGSAAMILRDVTPKDEGVYAVSLPLNSNDGSFNSASLRVIKEILFSVTMHGRTFNLSLAKNGTSIDLKYDNIAGSTWYHVRVRTFPPAPAPTAIRIVQKVNDQTHEEVPCGQTYDCVRNLDLFAPDLSSKKNTRVHIYMDFDIQNLDIINVTGNIKLDLEKEEKPKDKPYLACICDPVWEETPGVVIVLAGTRAVLEWKHPRHVDILVSWYHVKPDATEGVYRMSVTKIGTQPKVDKRDFRLDYIDYPGSATIEIANVAPADAGMYEVRLKDLRLKDNSYDCATANLYVIDASSVQYSVTMDGTTFDLSLDTDGADVVLPPNTAVSPQCFDISVRISLAQSCPIPRIHIRSQVNDSHHIRDTHTCLEGHTCSRYFSACTKYVGQRKVDIEIQMDFPVQNLDIVTIKRTLFLEHEEGANTGITIRAGRSGLYTLAMLLICTYIKTG